MLSYCLKCKANTKRNKPRISKTSHEKIILLSKCALCNSKKSRFINKQKISELLNKLGIRTSLSKCYSQLKFCFDNIKNK